MRQEEGMMRSVKRIFSVLESFEAGKSSFALHEIAGRVSLSKATVYRLLQSLEMAGYVTRLDNHCYSLSFRIVQLAKQVDPLIALRSLARPIMFKLAREANESVILTVARDMNRVCIDVVDYPRPLIGVSRLGQQISLVKGATAKALIASMPGTKQKRVIQFAMRSSGVNRESLERQLCKIREKGYAITYGESTRGMGGIAAPILEIGGGTEYAITVTGPIARLRSRENVLIKLVKTAASSISRTLHTHG